MGVDAMISHTPHSKVVLVVIWVVLVAKQCKTNATLNPRPTYLLTKGYLHVNNK